MGKQGASTADYGEKEGVSHSTHAQDTSADESGGLHRRLSSRQIQMVCPPKIFTPTSRFSAIDTAQVTIGGSIGTALFVSIGSGLAAGGPGSLLIAFTIYSCWLALVNNCLAEMTVFMPVSGGFVRLGSKWVDEAFGFMLGWNFFIYGEFIFCDVSLDV